MVALLWAVGLERITPKHISLIYDTLVVNVTT